MKILTGHVSESTAYLQPDYPYSFNLRCQRRVWVEYRKGFGQRMITQTENPKTGRWNKPKAGTYNSVIVLYLNEENGHIEHACLNVNDSAERVEKFVAEFGEALTGKYEQDILKLIRARQRVDARSTWTVVSGEEAKNVPSMDEQMKRYKSAIMNEMRRCEHDDCLDNPEMREDCNS